MRRNSQVIDKEVLFGEDEEIVSTTDKRGVITYVNDVFCRVSGFENEELIGKNHNIVRHPDMPKPAFKDLWSHLGKGDSWRGMVKNRCKDGSYYWVDAYVTPIHENNEIIGYQSVRVRPSEAMKQKAESAYQAINAGDKWATFELTRRHKFTSLLLLMMLVLSGLFYYGGAWAALLGFVAAALPLVVFWQDAVSMVSRARDLQAEFDSVSRFIYSGKGTASIFDFHLGLMKAKVRTILGRTQDATHELQSFSQSLVDEVRGVRAGITQQRDEIQQIATAINQMTTTSGEIADNTVTTSTELQGTFEQCEQARGAISSTSEHIGQLALAVDEAAQSADQLVDEAQKVGDLMSEIEAIADQTNLLALNAAIEAARAGENGRGFAVVADEVRALSSRTQQAADHVQQTLSGMLSLIRSWVDTMSVNRNNADECVQRSEVSRQAIDDIHEKVQQISDFTAQVATAAAQQGAVAEEIRQNIGAISNAAETNWEGTDVVMEHTETLRKNVNSIASLSHTFK